MGIFKNRTFALKGIIVHTPDFDHMEYHENEYVICKDGKSAGIFHELPEEYQGIPVFDFSDNNSDYLQKARKYGHFTGYKN